MGNMVSFLRNGDSNWAPPPVGLPRIGACLTWFEDGEGGTEPWPFLELLTGKLTEVIPGRVSPLALFLKRTRSWLRSSYREKVISAEPLSVVLARWKTDSESPFPDRIEFRSNGYAVCIIESEFWNQVGGPSPYHDSVTLTFYSTQISTDLLLATARTAAHECGTIFDEKKAA
jgi:hypothetical protein